LQYVLQEMGDVQFQVDQGYVRNNILLIVILQYLSSVPGWFDNV